MIRIRPQGIVSLEIWDLCVKRDRILWDYCSETNFGRVLRAAITRLWNGEAVTRSDGPVELKPRSFAAVFMAGGGSPHVLEEMQSGPWGSTRLAAEPVFAGLRGGIALLRERGLSGWTLDLGQSSLKLGNEQIRLESPRPWQQLPLREDSTDIESQRRQMRRWVAALLVQMLQATGRRPEGIVAGLSSCLDDSGVPEGNSYVGLKNDIALVCDAMTLAGLGNLPLFVLNDAELAAVSARCEGNLTCQTLVLTIGFGVGGALVEK